MSDLTSSLPSASIIGIDVTSAPSKKKPITVAVGHCQDTTLVISQIRAFASSDTFDQFSFEASAATIGIDSPFGMPRRLIENLGWPGNWCEYVRLVGRRERSEWAALLESYRTPRAVGDKEHKRVCDSVANSQSPMKMFGTPVGRMFHYIAPRLARLPWNIPLLRPSNHATTAVESYPALVVKSATGSPGNYKHDSPAKQTKAHRLRRIEVAAYLQSVECQATYQYSVRVDPASLDTMIDDASGDSLDAVLCAVQAAWAAGRPDYGIPSTADPLEGWIVDPTLLD